MLIIGIDPGKTTGVCGVIPPDNILCVGEVAGAAAVIELLRSLKPSLVIVESFKLYPSKAAAQSWARMYSSEVIGAVKMGCNSMGLRVMEQSPATRNMFSDIMFEAVGGFRATKGLSHARDALRHVLHYCQRQNPEHFYQRVKGGKCT